MDPGFRRNDVTSVAWRRFGGMAGFRASPVSGALLARVNLRFAMGVVGLAGFVRRSGGWSLASFLPRRPAGIPRSHRFARSRPLTLREGGVGCLSGYPPARV